MHQETEVAVTTVHVRWRRFDIPALLCVEMSRIEREVGVVYTLERWNQHYIGFVQVGGGGVSNNYTRLYLICMTVINSMVERFFMRALFHILHVYGCKTTWFICNTGSP